MKSPLRLALVFLVSSFVSAQATTFLHFQSTWLGDGWFQYQMTVLNDPFFSSAITPSLDLAFTNEIDASTNSIEWVNDSVTASDSGWEFVTNEPTSRPYEETFLVRSSESSYRLSAETNGFGVPGDGAVVIMSLTLSDWFNAPSSAPVFSANIAGYAFMPCLLPCPPEQANYAPTNFGYDLKLVPDVQIKSLVLTNGQVCGVDFIWDSLTNAAPDLFVFQGTKDFYNWTNIAYLTNAPHKTIWTTNQPLNDYGPFFRVALYAQTETQSYAGSRPAISPAGPRVLNVRASGSQMVVTIAAEPDENCVVQAFDSRGTVRQSHNVKSSGASSTVNFDTGSLPNPVFFKVSATP